MPSRAYAKLKNVEIVWALNSLWPGLGNFYGSGDFRWLVGALALTTIISFVSFGGLQFVLWLISYIALSLAGHASVRRNNRDAIGQTPYRRTADEAGKPLREGLQHRDHSQFASRRFEEKFRVAGKQLEPSNHSELGSATAFAGEAQPPPPVPPAPQVVLQQVQPVPSVDRAEYAIGFNSPSGYQPSNEGPAAKDDPGTTGQICRSCGVSRDPLRFTCPGCAHFYDA